MPPDNEPLDDAIEAISEGREVDWAEVQGHGDLSSEKLWALKALDVVRVSKKARGEDIPDLPEPLLERLQVGPSLGAGAFARVFLARDRVLGREVALKVLRRGPAEGEPRERFLEEAKTLAGLKHPNIVQIHWVEEHEGQVFLILELIKGKTLADVVEREGTLAPDEAARVGADLCGALAAIHGAGLVHMDIKPANIVREEGGRIVLLDFGFARASGAKEGMTDAPLGGTPLFMSPEILEGRTRVPPTSDIYSLGVLLYWAVSDRYPHDAKTFTELRERILGGEATPLLDVCPGVSRTYASVVSKAIARSEEERYRSAGALEEALRAVLARPEAREEVAPGLSASRRRRWPVAMGLAVAAIGFGWWMLFRSGGGLSPESHAETGTPPGPTVGTVSAPTATASLDVEIQMFVERGGKAIALDPGVSVVVGDELFLQVHADRAFHLWVFNEDEQDRTTTLFPIPAAHFRNPLAGGELQHVPSNATGGPEHWVVTSSGGGAEHFYVVASVASVPLMETLSTVVPAATAIKGKSVKVAELSDKEKGMLLRGVGGHTERHAEPSVDVLEDLGDLMSVFESSDAASGVVVRHIRVDH